MPKIAALGGLSSRGFGEFAQQTAANYIEDVFSTWLYTGNGSSQTITNGIDLAGKGGMVWIKVRTDTYNHILGNTVLGTGEFVSSNTNLGATFSNQDITSYNSNGFTVGSNGRVNQDDSLASTGKFSSWTFRKAAKFFDVITYTGNGANRTISHNLGSVPGMIIIKRTNSTSNWAVYHRSLANTQYLSINTTAAAATDATYWNSTTPTSTVFSLGTATDVNANGGTYVAYLFAHDAGGFGADGSQNVISCGSYTGNGSATGPTITLGYEPQFIITKCANSTGTWFMYDSMRGMVVGGADQELQPNTSGAEISADLLSPTATGFQITSTDAGVNSNGNTYIYMAIRRGPMRTPTDATKVFKPEYFTNPAATLTPGFPPDFVFYSYIASDGFWTGSRLTGNGQYLRTPLTNAEATYAPSWKFDATTNTFEQGLASAAKNLAQMFARAPGFFDVACYTGTGVARTVNHNLGVVPELIISKKRSSVSDWNIYNSSLGAANYVVLNDTIAVNGYGARDFWNSTTPTASVFSLGGVVATNLSGETYIAYLFASCPGVSKVGSYTGTGATQTISCGFTGGARYVLIKRTDSTGDWWVWDTARGMISGTDPRLAYNSTAAETNANWVYTTTGGFQIVTSDATVNANGGTYIYLAIA